MRKIYFLVASVLFFANAKSQTPVSLSSQPGLTYTENFNDIANWVFNGTSGTFSAGSGSGAWKGYAATGGSGIPNPNVLTTGTISFTTGATGGIQKGTGLIQFLTTGTTANTTSLGFDFFMDFTGLNAGTLTFNAATVFNSTGDRVGSLRVYASTNGSTWTELTGANLPYVATNNVAGAAPISVALPSSFNGSSTARIRFYYHNGNANGTTGSRPKISIDDLTVTATNSSNPSPSIAVSPSSLGGFLTAAGTASTSQSFTVSGSNLTDNITITPPGAYEVSLNNSAFSSSLTLNQLGGTVNSTTVYTRISSSASQGQANGTITLASGSATSSVSLSGTVSGVINLSVSPYNQNFNGIGSGLPAGISVKTGSTATILGTDAAFTTAPALWNNTSGGFKNFASGNNEQGVAQNTATDRAIGVRQTAGTDPGAAFVFQIANTSGKINFTLDFNLQSLDASSPRITTWRVDYGFGLNPVSFIVPSTSGSLTTGGNSFSNNPIHVDFGNAIDNQSGIVTIRIVALNGSTGSGNRPSTAIDDFTLLWEDPTAKTITLNATEINFPVTNVGDSKTASYKIVNQTNLDQPITIAATAPFSISEDNINFGSSLSIAAATAFDKTIYIKFSPTIANVYTGTITHNSEGTGPKIINLSGEAVDPNALTFNFNSCSVSSIPGSAFLSINIAGNEKWKCSQFGRNGTNAVDVNGFVSGAQTDDAWLISPALNLNNMVNIPVLSFYSRGEFTGPKLQVYVSTTYDGSSVPNPAEWALLEGNFPTPPGSATTAWTFSDNIDLSAYKSAAKVYIAFRYTSSPLLNAARWSLDDIAITDQSSLLTVSPSQLDFGEISVGTNSVGQPINLKAIGNDDLSVTPPAGYQISTDNTSFTSGSVVIAAGTATEGTTLYVRFSPVEKQLKVLGNINVSATGLNKNVVALTGSSFPKSETFDVACYNISFFGSNSTNTPTPTEITTQINNISAVMQRLKMDVIGIEEMSSDSALGVLVNTLPGYASVVSNRWSYSFNPPDPTFPPQKIGFVYNTATMNLDANEPPRVMFESMYDSARLNLPGHRLNNYPTGASSNFWASGRLPFMATFNANVDGVTQKIRLIVIHAKSGGDAESYVRRQYDVQVLKDSLDAFYANDKVIIVGDYNDRVSTSIYTGHESSFKIFVDDNSNYNVLTLPLDLAGKTSFPSSNGLIDHHTVTNEMGTLYISNSIDIEDARAYIPNYNATTASDHLPVFSRYQFCKMTPPSGITVSNDQGQCGAVVNFNVASTMTCGIVTAVPSSGSFFPTGTTTVKLTSSTGDTASFNVTVKDDEKPAITAPANLVISTDAGQCGAAKENLNLGNATYSDNCSGTVVTNDAPSDFLVGTTIVTWTATDAAGNTSTATQQVIVEDHELPTIAQPSDIITNSGPRNCSVVVSLTIPQTSDNCGVASITNDAPADRIFTVGTHTVTWTVTDVHGNVASVTQAVTVNDAENPTISSPNAVTASADAGKCYATNINLGIPETSDNCGVQSVTNDAPAQFLVGSTIVTWTVTDIHGNTATSTQTVTVTDNEKPVIIAPPAILIHPNNAGCTAKNVNLGTPTTGDNCGVQSVTNNAPLTYPVGTTTVVWTLTDIHGNIATANQTVTVTVDPPTTSSIPDVYAVLPGGGANTIYVGYGPSSITLNAVASGGAGNYFYKWTIGSSAGPALNSTSSYTVNPSSTTTYYLNVKDMYGCSAPVATKTVYVTDVRCGAKLDKITICSVVKGKPAASCVFQKDVASALSSGATLGSCISSPVTTRVNSDRSFIAPLIVSGMPNPSANYFTISIEGGKASEKLILHITDALGRIIERKTNLQTNSTLQIGSSYRPGVYIAEIIQGSVRKQIKLIKL